MNKLIEYVKRLLDIARTLLTGEPARAIGYGAAVVVWLVAKAFGAIPDQTIDEALVSTTAAIVLIAGVIESIRQYVFSPNTVEAIVAELESDST